MTENKYDGLRGEIVLGFQQSIQKSIEWEELEDVEFAMWLPAEQDMKFATSPIIDKWATIFSEEKLCWSYITADLLKTLKIIDEKTFRLGLPDEFRAFAFLTTDNKQIVLSLSKEKGVRLHFADTTSFEYRVKYLDNFIAYCKAWKELLEINNGKPDEDLGFDKWWAFTVETSKAVELNEPLTGVGKIVK